MIGQTVSHYRILNNLGEGAMSRVYVAEDTLLGRRVALKVLTAEFDKQHFRARMLREAQAVSSLSHPHIATIHEYGETPGGQPFIVMELVKGQTLTELIRTGTLTLSRALEIAEEIAEGLAEAHRHRILHRDIKPSNIAIDERGRVKILDFGLAKILSDNNLPTEENREQRALVATQTREGMVVGTPMYLSPEQALGLQLDARSDLFSLGSLLYECITGRPPFDGHSAVAICAKVIRDDPPPPSQYNPAAPESLDRLVLTALAKNADERYGSAEEMRLALRDVRRSLPESSVAIPSTPPSSIRPPKSRLSAVASLTDSLRKPYILVTVFVAAIILALSTLAVSEWLRQGVVEEISGGTREWYESGVGALHNGSYHTAAKRFEETIKAQGKFVIAHARLAESHFELDNPERANEEILAAHSLVQQGARLSPQDELYLKAITEMVKRNYPAAVEHYTEIVKRWPESPSAHIDLGRAYEKNEEADKAIESYLRATQLNPRAAAPFLRLGVLYGRQQNLPQSDEAFDRAEQLYQALSDQEGRAEARYQRAALLITRGKSDDARRYLKEALDITSVTGNPHQRVRVLLQLSIASYWAGDEAGARQQLEEGVRLAQMNNTENLTIQSLNDLGNFFFLRGRTVEAEKYFTQALELAQKHGARRSEARAKFSLGSFYIQQDNPEKGIPYLEQALAFYEQGRYRKESMQTLTLLGQASDLKGDYAQALQIFERLRQRAKEGSDSLQEALSVKNTGTVLAHQERYAEALRNFEDSFSLYSALNKRLDAGYSLVSRADMLWRLGREEEARAALNEAAALASQPGGAYSHLWGRIHLVRAGLELSRRRFSEAIAEARRAAASDDSETKRPTIEAQAIIGLAQSLSGAEQTGIRTCQEALESASRSGDPRLLSNSLLALAEAKLASGDAHAALDAATRARELFARSARADSEWRALLIAGRASQILGDADAARRHLLLADSLLSSLRQTWGRAHFESYLARPDITLHHKQLTAAAASAS